MKNEDWKRELIESFYAHKGILLVSTLVIFLGAVGVAFLWPPTYIATGSVLVHGVTLQANPDALGNTDVKNLPLDDTNINTEMQIVTSLDLIRQLIPPEIVNPDDRAFQLSRLQKGLVAEVLPATSVIAIHLYDKDDVWAERTLDELLRRYLVFRTKAYHPHGQEEFLSDRVEKYRSGLHSAEDHIVRLSADSSVTLPDREMANDVDLIRDYQRELNEIHLQRVQMENEIRPLAQALAEKRIQYFAFLNLSAIDNIGSRLKDLQSEYLRLERAYRPGTDPLQSVDAGIRTTYEQIRAEVEKVLAARNGQIEGMLAREKALGAAITDLIGRNVNLQRQFTEVQRANREVTLLDFSYQTFSKRAEEARINSAIASANFSGEVSILNWAKGSAAVFFPQKALTLALGFLIALITGCSLTLLVEFFDHTLKRSSDLARFSRLPLILSIRKA